MAHALTVLALFDGRESAEPAVRGLVQAGFSAEHVGYLEPRDVQQLKNAGKAFAEGILGGASSGAVIGGVLAAVAVGLIPGIGEVLVAGALLPVVMGAMTGSSTGAVAGGYLGAAAGGEEEPYFMQEVQAGRVLVSVEVPDTVCQAKAETLLTESGALEVDNLGTTHFHARLHHPEPE